MPVLFTLLTLLLVTITVPSMTAVPATAHPGRMHPDEEHESDDSKPVVLQKVAHDSPFSLRRSFPFTLEQNDHCTVPRIFLRG